MSTPVWTWRDAIRRTKAEPATKLLCYTLATYMSDTGRGCWPSVETLCDDTGMSARSITTHLAKAVEVGLLATSRRKAPDGRLQGYKYHPMFPKDAALARPEMDEDEGGDWMKVDAEPGANIAAGPGANNDKNQAQNLPLMNTSKENSQIASSRARATPKKTKAAAATTANTKAEKPSVLPEGWMIPNAWRVDAMTSRPECAAIVDQEAQRFAAFYRERGFVATADGWRTLFEGWWEKARVPQAAKVPQTYTVRDTSIPFKDYMAQMIAAGKYKPTGAAA